LVFAFVPVLQLSLVLGFVQVLVRVKALALALALVLPLILMLGLTLVLSALERSRASRCSRIGRIAGGIARGGPRGNAGAGRRSNINRYALSLGPEVPPCPRKNLVVTLCLLGLGLHCRGGLS